MWIIGIKHIDTDDILMWTALWNPPANQWTIN